jgi:sugar phosphate isomerase/epimerase
MALACSLSAFRTSLEGALAQIAGLGFEHVDLIAIPQWDHVDPAALGRDADAEAERAAALLTRYGLTPVAMNVGVPALYDRSAEASAERSRQVEGVAHFMSRLGIGVASFYPGYKIEDRPADEVLADTIETLREMLAVADAGGVTFAVEPHFATPLQSLQANLDLLTALPDLGVAYDPSHFAMQEIPLPDTAPVLDRAVHVHLRDAAPGRMQEEFGRGIVDFEWLLGALRERGYEGHCSLELLPTDGTDAADLVSAAARVLRPLLG